MHLVILAISQYHASRRALGALRLAHDSGIQLAKLASTPAALATVEDLDKNLDDDLSKDLNSTFSLEYPVKFPMRLMPAASTNARSYREYIKYAFTPRKLSHICNLYQQALKPPRQRELHTLPSGAEFSTAPKDIPEVQIRSLIDALDRIWLLNLSQAFISCKQEHTNDNGIRAPWFTLTDCYEHYSYLKDKATCGALVSVDDFLNREMRMRCEAIAFMHGSERLSLAQAYLRSRLECGDLWNGLYSASGVAPCPLSINPLLGQQGTKRKADGADGGSAAKVIRQDSFPGVHRASTAQETLAAGKSIPLKPGVKFFRGTTSKGCTLCGKFCSGKGCQTWPCGGAHACDIIGKGKTEPCFGGHTRATCPLNK